MAAILPQHATKSKRKIRKTFSIFSRAASPVSAILTFVGRTKRHTYATHYDFGVGAFCADPGVCYANGDTFSTVRYLELAMVNFGKLI